MSHKCGPMCRRRAQERVWCSACQKWRGGKLGGTAATGRGPRPGTTVIQLKPPKR